MAIVAQPTTLAFPERLIQTRRDLWLLVDTPSFSDSNTELDCIEFCIPAGVGGKREKHHLIFSLTHSAA